MAEPLFYRPATELLRLLRDGEVSAVDLTRLYLERIDRVNPALNAYVLVLADQALEVAAGIDRLRTRGEDLPVLAGLPVSVKDMSETAGVRTTYGSRAFADHVPSEDSEVVARLKGAGAILLGKTNTPEFAMGPSTPSSLLGRACNPWNLGCTPGDSTGGGAAAVAAGLCALAEGGDSAGSIRLPAAACGVVGLKPSRGRVPAGPLFGQLWSGLGTSGPLAFTVEDAALMLDVLAGPGIGEPYRATPPGVSFASATRREPAPLRIGVSSSSVGVSPTREVADAFALAVRTMEALDHRVEEVSLDTGEMWELLWQIAAANVAALPVRDPDLLGPRVRAVYESGRRMPAGDYARAVQTMYVLARRLVLRLAPYDLLVTPTVPRTAPSFDVLGDAAGSGAEEILRSLICFTFAFNMTGQPAISIPVGQSPGGLPIGMQLVGRQEDELTVLSAAAQLERAMPWRDRRPPL